MLVICNGAFKSGSTWVYGLVESILDCQDIPLTPIGESYGKNPNSPSKIAESKLQLFIDSEDVADHNYLTKAHFFSKETFARDYPQAVKFLFVRSQKTASPRGAMMDVFHCVAAGR